MQMIKNERKEEMDIWTLLRIDRFKPEVSSQDLLSENNETRVKSINEKITTYLKANYENDICNNLIEVWGIFMKKRKGTSTLLFQLSPMMHEAWEKKKKYQDSRNSENNRQGRYQHNQQRKKKIRAGHSNSRSNIKHDKKYWPTLADVLKEKMKKSEQFFRKLGHSKNYKKKDFKRWKLKIMTKVISIITIKKMNIT